MRRIRLTAVQIVATALASAITILSAQERVELVTDAYPGTGSVFEELDVSVRRFGEVRHVTHIRGGQGQNWVSLAGARYLVGKAIAGEHPYALVVFDRRTRKLLGTIQTPIFPLRLLADSTRPRVFLTDGYTVGVLDAATLTYRQIASGPTTTEIAYAPKADLLFRLEYPTIPGPPGPDISLVDVASGTVLKRFPAIRVARQIVVDSAGRHVYVSGDLGTAGPYSSPGLVVYDARTGQESVRKAIDLDEFVLDEQRGWLLADLRKAGRLAALHAETLATLHTQQINPPFPEPEIRREATILPGRWKTGAYIFRTIEGAAPTGGFECLAMEIEALDPDGTTRATLDALTPLGARPGCQGFLVLLRSPFAPEALSAHVAGRRVTLTWENPGDTSEFALEVGFSPGARALVHRVGLTSMLSTDNVSAGVYYVRVRAINEIGASPVSNEVRVVVP